MGSFFDLIITFLYDVVSAINDLIQGIAGTLEGLVKAVFDVFVKVPDIIYRFGLIVDSYLWFVPEAARYAIYAGFFAILIVSLVKIVVMFFKK